jgi:hypothetical protein
MWSRAFCGNMNGIPCAVCRSDGSIKPATDNLIHTTVAGPLCFSGDNLATRVLLPQCAPDDRVLLMDTGANTLSLFRYDSLIILRRFISNVLLAAVTALERRLPCSDFGEFMLRIQQMMPPPLLLGISSRRTTAWLLLVSRKRKLMKWCRDFGTKAYVVSCLSVLIVSSLVCLESHIFYSTCNGLRL